MRKKTLIGSIAAVLMLSTVAFAAGEFDVTGAKGEVAVVTKGEWHVNKDYPWKATMGDKSFDKSKFTFTEKTAKVSGVPAGVVHVKGAVCAKDTCMPFTKDVTVTN